MQKIFAKLTWRLALGGGWCKASTTRSGPILKRPTIDKPLEATQRTSLRSPAMNFGNLTHTQSANTLWDIRVGRFVSTQDEATTEGQTIRAGLELSPATPPARHRASESVELTRA